MKELTLLRTERNKTYDLGGSKRRIIASLDVVHYKDNYDDAGESWKDIDLTLINDTITKAPYTLFIDKKSIKKYYIAITDKRTGDTVEIKLKQKADVSTITDADFLVTLENTAVKVKLPHGSTISVTKSNAKLTNTKILHLADGADTFTDLADKEQASYEVEVQSDISVSVIASADDCFVNGTGSFDTMQATTYITFGAGNVAGVSYGSAGRWQDITIPGGATVDLANIILKSRAAQSGTTVKTIIRGEQSETASAFSTIANYNARTRTTAVVAWDSIPAWDDNESGADTTSPDIKSIFQELADDYAGLSLADVVLFWEDDLAGTGSDEGAYRAASSYDDGDVAPLLTIDYTAAAGWANIANVDGAVATDLASWCGAAVEDIANMSGADV